MNINIDKEQKQYSIKFRAYKKEDNKALEDIIRKTWNYDLFCSEGIAKAMAKLYLASCLANQSYTKVALLNDKPVGIIMAKNIESYKINFKNLINQFNAGIKLFSKKEGREVSKVFAGISDLDKKLLEERNKKYQGEIAFFAVNENCRGTGIGKNLFNKAMEYFRRENIKDFYLYTDSTCNYGFYEHQGLKRVGEKVYDVPIKLQNEMNFYLYEGIVK